MRMLVSFSLCITLSGATYAQVVVPGPADAGRIKPEERLPGLDRSQDDKVAVPSIARTVTIPKEARSVHFVLKEVRIEGARVFTPQSLRDIYAPYLGRDITLDVAYIITGAIDERYRQAGYFLSRAYVPAQEIGDGVVIIKVVEGYVGRVEMDSDAKDRAVVQGYIDQLLTQKPLTSAALESFLLRLNDMPGYSFSGVLTPDKDAPEGAVKLALLASPKAGQGNVSFDNYNSRFLGPNEAMLSYSKSLLALQQTSFSAMSGLPADRLSYATLNHAVAVFPDITLDLTGSYTKAKPAFTLEPFDIDSDSLFFSTSLRYQWLRQRQENLALKLTLDARNSSTDLLGTPFTRDRIRAVRANATYDLTDNWRGYNLASVTLSQGIDGLGSSKKGDLNLSRAQAKPDFSKAELALIRLQGLTPDWSLLMSAQAQYASGPLFSVEEFGYGGQGFGRAFDSSEITGDQGVSGSLELRYDGWGKWHPASLQPYVFYDIGSVWNDDTGQPAHESGASAGLGLRAFSDIGISGNIGLAWPLTRSISTPIYGQGSTGPRVLLQINQVF